MGKRILVKNYLLLAIVQGSNFVLPLITFPYLVRVLGVENFGLISFAQAFIAFFGLLTGFGFHLSATREVSIHRDNIEKLKEIFSSIFIIQLSLLIISFIIMSIIVFSVSSFSEEWKIYFLTFTLVIGQVLFPIWFFQGMEKMGYITVLNILIKVVYTVCIFIFVNSESDILLVPLFNGVSMIIIGIISIYFIFKDFKIRFILVSYTVLLDYLKDSSSFFMARASVMVYTVGNTFILGLVSNNTVVGYYSIAEKIFKALQQIYQPLTGVLYPYISKSKNIKLFKKIFVVANIVNVMSIILVYFIAPSLIALVAGKEVYESTEIFKILLPSVIVIVPSILLGYPFLAALGYKKYANNSVLIGSLSHLFGLLVLYSFDAINPYSIAILIFVTESIVLLIRLYGVRVNNLWSIK